MSAAIVIRSLILSAVLAPLFAQSEIDVRGTWRWSCCRGQHTGTFVIESQNSDGTFTGRFGDGPSDGKSPIAGRVSAAGFQFRRTIMPGHQTQMWEAQLSRTGGGLRTTVGNWSGFGFVAGWGDFQAERIGASSSAQPATRSSSLVGRWTWTCCRGIHAGSFTVQSQDAAGRVRGVFGNTASDGATPFEGTYSDGELVFTRFLTINGHSQRQVWRARVTGSGTSLRITDGRWSGFAADGANTDFQARFTGQR